MRTTLFRKALTAFEKSVRARRLNRFHSFERIKELLAVERARSERTGHSFSIILFGPISEKEVVRPTSELTLRRIGPTLLKRVRSTDHLGHFSNGRICVILPDTPPSGAHALAQSVMGFLQSSVSTMQTPETTLQVPFEVFSFPFPPSEDDSDAQFREVNRNGERGERSDRRGRVPVGGTKLASQSGKESPAGIGAATREMFVVRSLDELLSRPLPLWKRAADISGASVGLLLTSPLLLLAAALIRITSPGPILFRQPRCGLGGKPFNILKFRTMVVDAESLQANLMKLNEQDGPAFKIRNDPRITSIGKFLRKTSLDELPQLINILRGEMSLVGPRPLPIKEQHACRPWQRRRLDVTPGLTCIWQVSGRSSVSFDKWVRMDLSYIQRRTLLHDLKILMQTVPSVVLSRGAR